MSTSKCIQLCKYLHKQSTCVVELVFCAVPCILLRLRAGKHVQCSSNAELKCLGVLAARC